MPILNGFLLVNKPVGPTSHDVVDMVRRATGLRKVGHAGTLDPFASGLLIMALGTATKGISAFVGLDKTYEAAVRLGATSDTMDRTGRIAESSAADPGRASVEAALAKFRGAIMQTPPMYSAKKIGGRKLYALARAGKEVAREPVAVTIHELALASYAWPILQLHCRVGSGTYIRALAHDIGQALGTGAYLGELRRTAIGSYEVAQALPAAELGKESLEKRLFATQANESV